jgi:hypothetical protein
MNRAFASLGLVVDYIDQLVKLISLRNFPISIVHCCRIFKWIQNFLFKFIVKIMENILGILLY